MWKGFSADETDWVSIQSLREDVPVMLDEFLDDIRKFESPRQRSLAASI